MAALKSIANFFGFKAAAPATATCVPIATDELIAGYLPIEKLWEVGFAIPRKVIEPYRDGLTHDIVDALNDSKTNPVFMVVGLYGRLDIKSFSAQDVYVSKPEFSNDWKITDLIIHNDGKRFSNKLSFKLPNSMVMQSGTHNSSDISAFLKVARPSASSATAIPCEASKEINTSWFKTIQASLISVAQEEKVEKQKQLKLDEKATNANAKKAVQPLRFSSRRTYRPEAFCVTSAAAAELFKPYVCMTSLPIDIDVRSPFTFSVNPGAYALVQGTLEPDCKKKRFRAFKLGSPYHVAVALWDVPNKTIEVFDASGINSKSYQDFSLLELFRNSLKDLTIKFVNDQFLQQEDQHCQTWIYYYVYQRALANREVNDIVGELQKMTPTQRFYLINQFWHYLVRSG